MSGGDARGELLREIRAQLASWLADGISHVPRARRAEPPGARAQPAPARAPAPGAGAAVPAPPVPAAPVPAPRPAPPQPAAAAERTRPALPAPTAAPEPAPLAAAAQSTAAAESGGDPEALLAQIRTDLGDCRRCGLCEGRQTIVFGEGNPHARLVFVGEGPGADEDRSGRPFVGKAGELLTRMIESLGWQRSDVYICNVVKCRPPGNRDPAELEVLACQPFLERQLLAIGPRVIVTLGRPAASTLLGRHVAITRERGNWREWRGIPLMPTFHPAYLLRNYTREARQAVWDDLRAARARALGEDA